MHDLSPHSDGNPKARNNGAQAAGSAWLMTRERASKSAKKAAIRRGDYELAMVVIISLGHSR
jgi:hypothetical protein